MWVARLIFISLATLCSHPQKVGCSSREKRWARPLDPEHDLRLREDRPFDQVKLLNFELYEK